MQFEAMADGMGGWKMVDTVGMPWIDLPEPLRADLLTYKWLRGIGERIKAKQKPKGGNDGSN